MPSTKRAPKTPARRPPPSGKRARVRAAAVAGRTAKGKAPARGKRSARRPSPPSAAASDPYLRFYHSRELRQQTLQVITWIERADDATEHRSDLAEVVVLLMNAGLDEYFMKPLKVAGPGFVVQQSANVGLAGATRVMGSVIRNIIGRMDGPQLRSVSGSIKDLMR